MLGVIIPAYKRRDCLREALESLCNQTFKRFIVIVVDDHSDEPLKDVVHEFDDKLLIVYKYAEENGGPGAARQIGLEICYNNNIDLVMFLDSDDVLCPQAIARLTYEINHSNADIISSAIWAEDGYGTGDIISAKNKTWLHGKIYRTSYLKNNNIVFPSIRTNEDLAFNLIAIENTKNKKLLDEVLYIFRHESNSITRSKNKSLNVLSFDYVSALSIATQYFISKGKVPEQILIDIFNCYNHYQAGMSFNLTPSLETKQQLRFLLNIPEIKKILNSPSSFKQISNIPKQCFVYEKQIYYHKQSFYDWLKEFIDESSDN